MACDQAERLVKVRACACGTDGVLLSQLTCWSSWTTSTSTNRLSAATYDAAGNTTGWGGFTYTWDAQSQLVGERGNLLGRIFAYSADGERLLQRDGSSYTLSLRDLDGKVIRELSLAAGTAGAKWTWKKDTVYRNGLLLASVAPGEGIRHYHLDHLGTPRQVTNRTAQQLVRHDYWPYGREASLSGNQTPDRMRFTGHERDLNLLDRENDDLDYMHARYYNPTNLGRFMSVDADAGSASLERVSTWNRYAYVLGNPLKLTDPTGERWFQVYDKSGENLSWKYFPGVDYMEEVVAGKKYKVLGLQQFVTYDGSKLTLSRPDGGKVSFKAWSGLGTSQDVTSRPERQGKANEGPIPEGVWGFSPSKIETIGLGDALAGTVRIGPLKFGTWPGSIKGWGFQRVELVPSGGMEAGLRDLGRTSSGFYLHGGWSPGSRGCLDLVDNGERFFGWVDKTIPWVPVYVSYGGR